MKKRKIRSPDPNSTPGETSALGGYVELGMEKEALNLAKKILNRPSLTAGEFAEALQAVMTQADRPARLRPLIEAAHRKLSPAERRIVKADLFRMYCSINDWEAAHENLPPKLDTAADKMFAMEILLHFGKLDRARSIARRCENDLNRVQAPFDRACLIVALACYLARRGQWDEAAAVWGQAPLSEPFASNALCGVVKAYAAKALVAARAGLEKVAWIQKNQMDELQVTLPGNQEKLLDRLQKELLKLHGLLERIVSKEDQRLFGFP